MATISTFNDIQDRIDKLYDTNWLQQNAFFPVVFSYADTKTDSNSNSNSLGVVAFRDMHTNNIGNDNITSNPTVTLETATIAAKSIEVLNNKALSSSPSDLVTYQNKLNLVNVNGIKASSKVLRQLTKVSGLKNHTVPVSKLNNALKADAPNEKDTTLTLEFLADEQFEVLNFLQCWQSKWYSFEYQKKSLKSLNGGEGLLSLMNCSIDTDGNITPKSYLTIFGLIPKTINVPGEYGPQVSTSSLPKITLTCTYSDAILVYPAKDKLNYYYFE